MRLHWTVVALADLEELGDYVAGFNPDAANRIVGTIFEQTHTLAQFPLKGRIGRVPMTRELVIPGTSFIVAYRVQPDQIDLLAVVHTKRRWSDDFG